MAANRKLQATVDRTLKRINEGTTWFAGMWEKLDALHPSEHAGKEKISNEMKKELKKMQRMRDQVRAWAVDAPPPLAERLAEARQAVEHEMERFREVERSLKIRNFSKTGLLMDASDPEELAHEQCAVWVCDRLGDINLRIETWGADLEDAKSAGNANAVWLDDIRARRARFEIHACKLEQVLRALENNVITPDDVYDNLRDNLDYLLDGGEDDEDLLEGMYDALPLACIDPLVGRMPVHRRLAEEVSIDGSDDVMTHSASMPASLAKASRRSERKSRSSSHAKSDMTSSASAQCVLGSSSAKTKGPAFPVPPPPPPPPRASHSTNSSATATPQRSMMTPQMSPLSSPVSVLLVAQGQVSVGGRTPQGSSIKTAHSVVGMAHDSRHSSHAAASPPLRSHSNTQMTKPLAAPAGEPSEAGSHTCSPRSAAGYQTASVASCTPAAFTPAFGEAMTLLAGTTPSSASMKSCLSEPISHEVMQGLRKNLLQAFNAAASQGTDDECLSHSYPEARDRHASAINVSADRASEAAVPDGPATVVASPLRVPSESPLESKQLVSSPQAGMEVNPALKVAEQVLVSPERKPASPAKDAMPTFPPSLDSPVQCPTLPSPPAKGSTAMPGVATMSNEKTGDELLKDLDAVAWQEYLKHTHSTNAWLHNAQLLQAGFASHIGSSGKSCGLNNWQAQQKPAVQESPPSMEKAVDLDVKTAEGSEASPGHDDEDAAKAAPDDAECRQDTPQKDDLPRCKHSYPTTVPDVLRDPLTYRRLAHTHPDMLFAAFYCLPNTPFQCMAAAELHRAGWRLHRQYGSWFQRIKKPVHMDEACERGHVVFFNNRFPASAHPLATSGKQFTPEKHKDPGHPSAPVAQGAIIQDSVDQDDLRYGEDRPKAEAGWCHMQIPDFTFEYEHLERTQEASHYYF